MSSAPMSVNMPVDEPVAARVPCACGALVEGVLDAGGTAPAVVGVVTGVVVVVGSLGGVVPSG